MINTIKQFISKWSRCCGTSNEAGKKQKKKEAKKSAEKKTKG